MSIFFSCVVYFHGEIILFPQDKDGVINEAKTLLYRLLKDKLLEELNKRDSLKIRNAINRFALYGVTVSNIGYRGGVSTSC